MLEHLLPLYTPKWGKYGVNGGKFHMCPNIIKEHIKLLV